MKIDSFGTATSAFGTQTPVNDLAFTKNAKKAEAKDDIEKEGKRKKQVKTALLAASLTALGVIGVTAVLRKKNILPTPNHKLNSKEEKPWLAILALAGIGGYEAGSLTRKDTDEIIAKLEEGNSDIQKATFDNQQDINKIKTTQQNATLEKYSKDYYGLSLLTMDNVLNKNSAKYAKAIKQVQTAAFDKLTTKPALAPLEKENPVVWSITSEFAPVKEGGLGSVPPEIRNNAVKLGVNMPTFVPMYLNGGMNSLQRSGNNYNYSYKGKDFELSKVVDFKMDVFQAGRVKTVPVSIFLNEDNDEQGNKRQLLFIKCDEYFDGTIYEGNSKTEEPEKFAVMSKAVYEFAKLVMDGKNAIKDTEIPSSETLAKVQAPDAMILNDWQASPIAALCRYKAGMENAFGQLSDKTTSDLQNMRIITIGHNAMYQGSTQSNNSNYQRRSSTNNILNTLFDRFTYDIVENANIGVEKIDPEDKDLNNLDNVLVLNHDDKWSNHTNFLNMGIVLSDYFCPVSKNYARELISPEHPDLSYILQWPLIQKAKSERMVGVINGNDFNGLSIEAIKARTKQLTGLTLETYQKSAPKSELTRKRLNNKINMYRNYVLPFSESKYSTPEQIHAVKDVSSRLEFYSGDKETHLPNLTDEQIANTPILTSGGRLVSQKGINVLCDAIKILFDNWEKDFKDKPKPIFYIAGADGENGTQRAYIEKLKNEDLSKEDNNRVLFAHGFAPMSGLMATSDYFLMPSIFEPCGLTQGESLAVATPVIASAVGGIVDTINRNGCVNGVLTTKEKPLDANEYYEAMKRALTIYFDDREFYNTMVKNSIDEDFSWIQPGRKGPVYDYLELIGINRTKLPNIQ